MRLTPVQRRVVAELGRGAGLRAQVQAPHGAYWTADFDTVQWTTLNALIQHGFVTKWRDETRRLWVVLTPAGRAVAEKLRESSDG